MTNTPFLWPFNPRGYVTKPPWPGGINEHQNQNWISSYPNPDSIEAIWFEYYQIISRHLLVLGFWSRIQVYFLEWRHSLKSSGYLDTKITFYNFQVYLESRSFKGVPLSYHWMSKYLDFQVESKVQRSLATSSTKSPHCHLSWSVVAMCHPQAIQLTIQKGQNQVPCVATSGHHIINSTSWHPCHYQFPCIILPVVHWLGTTCTPTS